MVLEWGWYFSLMLMWNKNSWDALSSNTYSLYQPSQCQQSTESHLIFLKIITGYNFKTGISICFMSFAGFILEYYPCPITQCSNLVTRWCHSSDFLLLPVIGWSIPCIFIWILAGADVIKSSGSLPLFYQTLHILPPPLNLCLLWNIWKVWVMCVWSV